MKSIDDILKMAANVQEELTKAQASLDTIEVEGVSGGGMVKVTTTAKGAVKAVSIDPSLMNAGEREILEDLIIAACADAKSKAERIMEQRMAEITKGLPIPPGMKLF